MIKNADEMKEKDKLKREMVDAKNDADTAIHTTEKSLNEYKDKLGQADIDEINKEITALKEMVGEPSTEL